MNRSDIFSPIPMSTAMDNMPTMLRRSPRASPIRSKRVIFRSEYWWLKKPQGEAPPAYGERRLVDAQQEHYRGPALLMGMQKNV